MAIYIKNLKIHNFRGLRGVELNGFNQINLFCNKEINGPLSCGGFPVGKTSIFEAMSLIQNPFSLDMLIRILRVNNDKCRLVDLKELVPSPYSFSNNKFSFSFEDNNDDKYDISYALYFTVGDQSMTSVVMKNSEILKAQTNGFSSFPIARATISKGSISLARKANPLKLKFPIIYNEEIEYSDILKNTKIKNFILDYIREYDPDIKDINYSESSGDFILTECKKNKSIPLYMFGSGIMEILKTAAIILSARNGILLIEDWDNKISSERTTKFYLDLIKDNNIQAFMTCNQMSTIKSLIKLNSNQDISIFTMSKQGKSIAATKINELPII